MTKTCTRCGIAKYNDDFYFWPKKKRFDSWCKKCHNEARANRRKGITRAMEHKINENGLELTQVESKNEKRGVTL